MLKPQVVQDCHLILAPYPFSLKDNKNMSLAY